MTLVIDTDVFIDFLQGVSAAHRFMEECATRSEQTLFSAITELELIAGKLCDNPVYKTKVLAVLSLHKKAVVDNAVAVLGGDVRRIYAVSATDSIIAATSLLARATLITRNVKDFRKVKALSVRKPY